MSTNKNKEAKPLGHTAKGEPIDKKLIDKWKNAHGAVTMISVDVTEKDKAVGFLKKPTRNVTAKAMSLYNLNKVLETGEYLLQNCWIDGDERLINDEDVSMAAAVQAKNLVEFKTGSLEKL